MTNDPDIPAERLTEYERAICYYTLPGLGAERRTRLFFLYMVLFAATVGLTAYGLMTQHPNWSRWGPALLGVTVAVGVLGFLIFAIRKQVQERAALAEAEDVPNVESGFDDFPDPFADHTLMRYYRKRAGDEFVVADNKGASLYRTTVAKSGKRWDVSDPSGEEIMSIVAVRGARSFSLGMGMPSNLVVTRGGVETAELQRAFSLTSGSVTIRTNEGDEPPTVFLDGAFYRGARVVGRIYVIRNFSYLDIDQNAMNDGILALYFTMA